MSTLAEYLVSQQSLLQEASLALPHSFSTCTYRLGPIRQPLYLCTTCASPRGICAACSVACHTDHEQIELFAKRNFTCDCPTKGLAHPCSLHRNPVGEGGKEEVNAGNEYGGNFEGKFCRCGREYDAATERETMVQCLACEDWYHESCLNLRERPPPRSAASSALTSPAQPQTALPPISSSTFTETPTPATTTRNPEDDAVAAHPEDEVISTSSHASLPPSLLPGSTYDALICGACTLGNPVLRKWAGTPGIMMVVRPIGGNVGDEDRDWRVIGREETIMSEEVVVNVETGDKRPREDDGDGGSNSTVKKARLDGQAGPPSSNGTKEHAQTPCLAPPPNPIARAVLERNLKSNDLKVDSQDISNAEQTYEGAGDIFLTDGWRQRWCHCSSCHPPLAAQPYLLEEEESYEPPEDPDSGLSLEELGMRALERIPREKALDGIREFNKMRDDLFQYLRPFAQEGKVVDDAAVKAFFDERLHK